LNDLDGTLVECPENEVITGLEIRCGFWMDKIRFYCGSNGLLMPTSTPTQQPTVPGGTQFYDLEWFWWAFSAVATIVVAMCFRFFLYRVFTRRLRDISIQFTDRTALGVEIVRNDRVKRCNDSPIIDGDKEGSSMENR